MKNKLDLCDKDLTHKSTFCLCTGHNGWMTKHHYVISWGWESVGYNNILDLCWVSTVVRTCSDSFWEQWHHIYTLSEEMDRTLKLSISRKHMVAIWDVIHKPHKPLSDTSRPPIFFSADMCYWGPRTAQQQLTSTDKADSDSPCCWRMRRVCVFCVCFLWKPSMSQVQWVKAPSVCDGQTFVRAEVNLFTNSCNSSYPCCVPLILLLYYLLLRGDCSGAVLFWTTFFVP